MTEQTNIAPIFTDDDLEAICAMRTRLEQIGIRAGVAGFYVQNRTAMNERDASGCGAVSALADSAASALFDLLNWASSRNVQEIPDAILYNKRAKVEL